MEALFAFHSKQLEETILKKFSFRKRTKEREKPREEKEMNERDHLIDLLIHDLTTPLSIVSASVVNLLYKSERYGSLTEPQKRILERILRNNRKAQFFLQEMIEITRSKEGFFKKEFFPIQKPLRESILEVLENMSSEEADKLYHIEDLDEFKYLLEAQGIFVEIRGKYCQHPFCHDQKKIQQIIRNLLSNALKYRRNRIDLSISGEEELVILIKDDGRGIPEGDQDIIFQRFVRLKDKRTGEVPGLGLGLAGVKTLIEAMGGEITLESHEELGTCFTVRVPPL